MDKLLARMKKLGFTQEEAEKQLSKLNGLILLAVAKKISRDNDIEPTKENLKKVINEKYSKEEYKAIFVEVSSQILNDYLDAITQDLPPLKRKEFLDDVYSNA